MRVLITGITGFVGRHLSRCLAAADCSVCGLSTDPGAHVEGVKEGDLAVVDLRDTAALTELVARWKPEVVAHLGGLSHVGRSWQVPGEYLRVNFHGTVNLLEALADSPAKGRVLFASSAEVYGPVAEGEQPIREDHPLDPRSPYAMVKACGERVVLDAGGVVVRSFNTVGPGQAENFALPSFARQLAAIGRGEQDAEIRVGDLSPRRDFIHVADAVDGYARLVEHAGSGGSGVYNLASGEAHSIADALDRLRAISGVEAEVVQDPARMRPVDLPLLCGDAGRLRGLGWEPSRGLDGALEDLWREVSP